MSQGQWFLLIDKTQHGPLSPAELKQMVDRGDVVADTPIRKDGMSKWVRAKQVQGLLPAEPAHVPQHQPEEAYDEDDTSEPDDYHSEDDEEQYEDDAHENEAHDADSYDDEDHHDADDDDPVARRGSIGKRFTAALIDASALAIGSGLLIVIAILIAATILGTAVSGIDAERAKSNVELKLPPERQMPPFLEWQVTRELGNTVAAPDEITRGENEGDMSWWERQQSYNQQRADFENAENLFEWREERYQKDFARYESSDIAAAVTLVIFTLFAVIINFLYYPILEGRRGRTIGQQVMGLMVVGENLKRCGIGRAFLRMFARVIPFFFVTIFGQQRLTLSDSLTKTQVVRAECAKTPRNDGDEDDEHGEGSSRGHGRSRKRGQGRRRAAGGKQRRRR